MKITILLFFALTTPLFAASRAPAVDPVTGISIEEYREVNPATTQGYDFSQDETTYEQAPKDTHLSFTTAFFLVVASALPFVVWFGVMRALPDAAPQPTQEQAPRPTLSVVENSESPHDDDDEHHWPKAS